MSSKKHPAITRPLAMINRSQHRVTQALVSEGLNIFLQHLAAQHRNMASVDKEGEKQMIKILQELLHQLYELETIAGDFTQPNSQQLLLTRLQEFQQTLQRFKEKSAVYKHLQVPAALLNFVDEGGHPDDFVRMQFRRAAADSQIAAGRVAALQAMREELLSQCDTAFPDDTAVYKSVAEAKMSGS